MSDDFRDTLRRAPPTPAAVGITDAYSATEADATFLPLAGGTLTGSVQYGSEIGAPTQRLVTSATVPTGGAATTVLTIASGAHVTARRFVLAGENGTDAFLDVVIACVEGAGNVAVVSSTTVLGTPRNRTWTLSASAFKLALDGAAGQTYTIRATQVDL